MVAQRDEWLSIDDFLALDRESLGQKYEYRDGRMVAMAGGSTHHGILIANMHMLLGQHLRRKPCFAFVEMTVKLESSCLIPDLMVTCNEQDLTENKTYIESPGLVIEVLSPSTESDDRGEKFFHYINSRTIQEYVLINYKVKLLQMYTKKGLEWVYSDSKETGSIALQTIGLTVTVEEVYDRIVLPPPRLLRKYKGNV
jgi:Uma2 family endonuclease